jgi:tetratricopeptide (TPR) repeat protein
MLTTLSILALSVVTLGPQAPAGWDQTYQRAALLMTRGQAAQAITLLEQTVAQAPGFEEAEFELGKAHQFRAGELAIEGASQDALRRRHLEQAARVYKQVAARNGQYRQPALGWLLMVYDEDELGDPVERAAVAQQYIVMDPTSVMGHVARAVALRRSGHDVAAWAALDAACAAVSPDQAPVLARAILMQLTEALPQTTGASQGATTPDAAVPKELARLLDYAEKAIDRELASGTPDRSAWLAKVAALTLRAQRLERDPARRKALEAEVEALFASNRAANMHKRASNTAPDANAPTAPPPGFAEVSAKADALLAKKKYAEAAAIYQTVIASHPAFPPPHYLRVNALIRAGQSASVESALRAARKAIPVSYDSRYLGALLLEELVRKNATIGPTDGTRALTEAVALLDEALSLKPNDYAALTYKSLAIRGQARFASDPAAAERLTAEADRLREAARAAQPPP